MPVNRRWPIREVLEACRSYTQKTKREVTFEYLLAKGLNASRDDAGILAALLDNMQCKVNLIPLNPIPEFPYKRPSQDEIRTFERILNREGIKTTIRFSTGKDINAACGELIIQ